MSNERVVESWSSAEYAAKWHQADGLSVLLELPWAMATALVGRERSPRLVVDVGSGPGTFLATVLRAYPEARGVWIDASTGMRERAEQELGPFAGRVDYVVEDATRLAGVSAAHGADVVLNSRVAHHFDHDGLVEFYAAAAEVLQPDGWLVTLDHVLPPGEWDRRYREVLPTFAGPNAGKPTHPHFFPFPTMTDHLSAMADAGLVDCDLAWRTFYTCLFLGRRAVESQDA
ncbi:MAG: tRNA (cmo5U34)-methyltransferase [Mycobacterium sp.]|jgi:SAM-dependent methyltransferase|nr:tRNA (cmo5U34)-methyltransferase [Mycobacterium sp.]